ncbi:MAG: LCP family protein [Actinomycetota bacterium]|nr:LCP family protein [Actinomycetota bacterium]
MNGATEQAPGALPVRWGLGRGRRKAIRIAAVVAAVAVAAVAAIGGSLYRVAEHNVERVDLPALADKTSAAEPINVLVVGSDSRDGLTRQEREAYVLGPAYAGQRGDSVILVSISPDRADAAVVSFPRDLLVVDGERESKLTETFARGPDHVVEVLQRATGVPIHHYVEMSIPGFLDVLGAIGGVELCIDYDLHDVKSGSDLQQGCHELTPAQALAFVRSRSTPLGDFDRIERQQVFMRALLDRLIATRTLVDVPRLFAVVDDISSNVTTDSNLGVGHMRSLAKELRGLAEGQVPMVVVPGYTDQLGTKDYVVAYEAGARALYRSLRLGRPIPPRGPPDERRATGVTIWSGGRDAAAELVRRTLFWSAFAVRDVVPGPAAPPPRTVVYASPGHELRAAWVAATLGATVVSTPDDVRFPDGVQVIVAVGADAQPAGAGGGDGKP